MRTGPHLLALAVAATACAAPQGGGPAATAGELLQDTELTRVRCLVVAPLENASDTALAAEAATDGLLGSVDPARARVFPVPELRALFRDTSLELPLGISPSLAVELAELLGADAVLYGAVEGRGSGGPGELLVTVRLALAGERRLLFARTAVVVPAAGERSDEAVRRTAVALASPVLQRIGDPGRKRCFEADRTRALREFALAEGKATAGAAQAEIPTPTELSPVRPEPSAALSLPKGGAKSKGEQSRRAETPTPATAATSTTTPTPAPTPDPPPTRRAPRTARQADWARTLGERGRILVEDLTFEGRTATIQRDGGLADLAVALAAVPDLKVRLDGFVDATSDPADDAKLALAMAQAAAQRLFQLGVDRSRLTWAGRGGDRPLLPNFTARGRAANRRIEVTGLP